MSSRFSGVAEWGHRHRRLGHWSLGVLVALSIVVAILVSVFIAATFVVPGYHGLIAKKVSAQLHAPVTIGRVALGWHGWGPELDFRTVRVKNAKTGKVVLSAKALRLDIPLAALIHGAGARPSAIALDEPHLTLVKTAQGLRVPGLRFEGGGPGPGSLGMAIAVHDGTLRLEFANAPRKSWTFAPLDLAVGAGKTHAVTLAVGLPAALGGDRLRAAGSVKTPKMKPGTWQWQGTAGLDRLPLAPLDPWFPAGWPKVTGTLAFHVKANGHGARLRRASGRLELAKLAANQGHLRRFATRFAFTSRDGIRLALHDDAFELPGTTWRPGKVVLAREPDGRLEIAVATVKLAALPALAKFLPPSRAKLSARIAKMRPSGTVHGLDLAFKPGEMHSLDFAARLDDVGAWPAAGAPGFNHVAGTLKLARGMGVFALDAPGFTLRMPHLFPRTKKVSLERLVATIGIAVTGKALHLAVPRLRLSGKGGLNGALEATMTIPRDGRVHARLAARVAPIHAGAARSRYIPSGLLHKKLSAWLMNQLHSGRAGPMRLSLVGDIKRFPFQHGGGRFSVVFPVHEVGLAPGKGWAPITGINGTVHFEDAAMQAEIGSARVEGARVLGAHATIPDLFHPRLAVKTTIVGTLPEFMAFLENSPVAGKLNGVFSTVKVAGKARTRLALQLPIRHPKRLRLAGKIRLEDAAISSAKVPWPLEAISGSLSYDQRGPSAARLSARLLDAPIQVTLARKKRGTKGQFDVALAGRFPVATLSKLAGFDFGRYASGELPLRATVAVPLAQHPLPFTVNFSSDLEGFGIKLPAPAGKSPDAKRPLDGRARVGKQTFGLEARYGKVASVCGDLALGGRKPTLERGEFVLGAGACKRPAAGLAVRGGWPELDVKPWLAVLPRRKAAAADSGGGAFDFAALGRMKLDLHFGILKVLGQVFKDQSIRGSLDARESRFAFGGSDLAGTVAIPRRPTNSDPIEAVLTRGHFVLPQKPVVAASSASAARAKGVPSRTHTNQTATRSKQTKKLEPSDIPPFDLTAKHLLLGTAALNNVKIDARRVQTGVIIKPIYIGGGALNFTGQFAWLDPPASGEQGALQFVANVASLGKLFVGLGLGKVATGHGALSASLAWHEPRGSGTFAQGLLGKVSTDLRDGNISEVSPGAGRLLSLLSLVNIPRYLVFNFHNLFSKGFPYSRVYGDYDIQKGIAHTNGLKIESSIANIDITGDVNLVNDTMDQIAEVEPNYFGSLPVIGAIVGGLGVGAAIYALTKLFGNPINKALAMHYRIQGPITNPEVRKVGGNPTPPPAPSTATAAGR